MSVLIGQTLLGRYRVEAFLGRGGMSEVYKVWDSQRSVHLAMKMLREDLAEDKVFLRRFQREAQTLARLQHPNIVRFYGLEQDGPLAFMLMDYVEGTTLRREILEAKGPLPLERVLEILRPVCAALHYAHTQGMVHCDVKPGNIMIDRNGTVMLTDFGIARMTDAATATMVGLGTPAYMAPELVRGQDPTPQTDIYALGVVLYEMLTGGERPFTGERATVTGSTSEKVRWEQVHLMPSAPTAYTTDISPEVEAVVLGCLEKEPGKRYGSALEVLRALQEGARSLLPVTLEAESPQPNSAILVPPVAQTRVAPRSLTPWTRVVSIRRGRVLVAGGIIVLAVGLAFVGLGPRGLGVTDVGGDDHQPSTAGSVGAQLISSPTGPVPGTAAIPSTSVPPSDSPTDAPEEISSPTVSPHPTGLTADTVDRLTVIYSLAPGAEAWALSPDWELLACGSSDGTVRLFRAQNGLDLGTLDGEQGHTGRILELAFSPDGARLASGSADHTVRVWNIDERSLVSTASYFGWPSELVFSPDASLLVIGDEVATGDEWRGVQVWRTEDLSFRETLADDFYSWESVPAFSPDGSVLVFADHGRGARLWDVVNGSVTQPQGDLSVAFSLRFSPDGDLLAGGGQEWGVRLWDARGGELVGSLDHPSAVRALAFSADGTMLASAGTPWGAGDPRVHIWRVADRSLMATLGTDDRTFQLLFSADGSVLLRSLWHQLEFWRVEDGSLLRVIDEVSLLASSPDGSRLAAFGEGGTLSVWGIGP